MLKIGVRLTGQFEDAGEYLADARALDAAGVDSLWLDAGAGADSLWLDGGTGADSLRLDGTAGDPWLLLGGIAAVTGRARLVAPHSSLDGLGAAALRIRIGTLARLSRGRAALTVAGSADAREVETVVGIARSARCCAIVQIGRARDVELAARCAGGILGLDAPPEVFRSIVEPIARLRERAGATGPFEQWAAMAMPEDREGWLRSRREYESAGATGVIVPADPRLLDLLRNGDEEDDRSDLGLAQG